MGESRELCDGDGDGDDDELLGRLHCSSDSSSSSALILLSNQGPKALEGLRRVRRRRLGDQSAKPDLLLQGALSAIFWSRVPACNTVNTIRITRQQQG